MMRSQFTAVTALLLMLTSTSAFQTTRPLVVAHKNAKPSLTTTTTPGMMKTHHHHTSLNMQRRTTPEPQQQAEDQSPSFNVPLILQNLANQALLGATIWIGGPQYQVLVGNSEWSVVSIATGLTVGLLPLLFISRQIENSDSYIVSGLNLSTNMAVLRLFGSKPQPLLAGVASLLMASLTGIVEETTFRGQILPAFSDKFGGGDPLIGLVLSSLLFAVLHCNPTALFKGGEAALDNFTLLALQFVNGSIFAALYLATGNLAVPIVAHAAYDFYTFYKTHLVDVAGQMEYAMQQQSEMPQFRNKNLAKKYAEESGGGSDFLKSVQESFYLMDTNRDGVLSPRELRIALFSYGINLSQAQTQKVAAAADLDANSEIDMDEFLAFVGPAKGSTAKAVRYTLFGPI